MLYVCQRGEKSCVVCFNFLWLMSGIEVIAACSTWFMKLSLIIYHHTILRRVMHYASNPFLTHQHHHIVRELFFNCSLSNCTPF